MWVLGAIIILLFVFFSHRGLPILEEMERSVYDREMRFIQLEGGDISKIAIIDIDDKSISSLGAWPWPRYLIAEMTNILKENGAKLIGLNIPFYEKELNQGIEELRALRDRLDVNTIDSEGPVLTPWIVENLERMKKNLDNDSRLVESARQSGNIILPVLAQFERSTDGVERKEDPVLFQNFLTSYNVSDSLKERFSTSYLASPFSELAKAAQGLGHASLTFEQETAGRAHPMFVSYKGFLLPSFPLRLAIAYFEQEPKEILVEDNRVRLKDYAISTTKGEMLIKFQNGKGFLRYSFVDILKGKLSPKLLKGKIIVVGVNSKESRRINTPVSSHMSESELIANILDNIINNQYISRPAFMFYIELVAMLLMGGVGVVVLPQMGQLRRLGWAMGLVALTLVVGMLLFFKGNIWFKTVHVAGSFIAIYLMVSARQLLLMESFPIETNETHRLIGIDFQTQGLLDLAFEKFRKLPMDSETRDLIYKLGLEYERKGLVKKALAAFEYINAGGGYPDLEDRIDGLRESVKSSTISSHDPLKRSSVLVEASPEARSKIGRYEILEEIGRGTMGLVYKALDPKINRLLAIKTIRFSDEFDEDVIKEIKERFFREAEIAGKLSHPSIVTIYDMGDDGDLTYMAMEFLEGEDLDKFVDKKTLLPFRRILDLAAKVAEALEFAHNSGVIHRDIKPANIMLLKNDEVKVTDFGIAKAISSSRTRTGVILGTPNYMSPEQIMGQKVDSRSDIFSLGVLCFQLFTGELPFHGENLSSLLYEITQVKHPSLKSFNKKFPKVCEKIIDRALAKNPDDRFKTAEDMARVMRILASRMDLLKRKKTQKERQASTA